MTIKFIKILQNQATDTPLFGEERQRFQNQLQVQLNQISEDSGAAPQPLRMVQPREPMKLPKSFLDSDLDFVSTGKNFYEVCTPVNFLLCFAYTWWFNLPAYIQNFSSSSSVTTICRREWRAWTRKWKGKLMSSVVGTKQNVSRFWTRLIKNENVSKIFNPAQGIFFLFMCNYLASKTVFLILLINLDPVKCHGYFRKFMHADAMEWRLLLNVASLSERLVRVGSVSCIFVHLLFLYLYCFPLFIFLIVIRTCIDFL